MASAPFGQRTVLDAPRSHAGDVVMTTQVSARSTRLAWVLCTGPAGHAVHVIRELVQRRPATERFCVIRPKRILVMALDFLKVCGARATMAFAFVASLLSINSFGADPGVVGKGAAAADNNQHKLAHEPHYKSTPRYALLAFGAKGESKVWLVE